jgi:hypothetical protein
MVSAFDAVNNDSGQSSQVCTSTLSTNLDVSGCWTLYTFDGAEHDTFEMELGQTGNTVSGKFFAYKDNDLYEWYLSGNINGPSINFVAQGAIYFTGTIYGDSMSGTFDMPELQESGTWSAERNTCGIDNIPPSIPTNLSATAVSSSEISLTWGASTDTGGSGVAGYNIYRNGNLINGLSTTNYTDGVLSPNTQYCYTVSAYDAAGNVSAQSSQFCATTLSFSAVFRLPDTGQTKCYRATDPWDEIPCAGTGQDGEYNINPLSYTDNGNGTVTDNNTGLMWQKEDDGNIYNWCQASGTYHPEYNPSSQNVCGSITLGSYSDWRLPSKKELITIVNYGIPFPGPTIDPVFTNTNPRYFWSSSALASRPDLVWGVNFAGAGYGGSCVAMGNMYDDFIAVRCVRGGKFPSHNFVDNDDGTITDNVTGLMWQQGEPGIMPWDAALSYCESLLLGGNSDWRLPNIKELESLTDDSRDNPAIDKTFFLDATASLYWTSSSQAADASSAYIVGFSYPGVDWENKPLSDIRGADSDIKVRCVRGGQ